MKKILTFLIIQLYLSNALGVVISNQGCCTMEEDALICVFHEVCPWNEHSPEMLQDEGCCEDHQELSVDLQIDNVTNWKAPTVKHPLNSEILPNLDFIELPGWFISESYDDQKHAMLRGHPIPSENPSNPTHQKLCVYRL